VPSWLTKRTAPSACHVSLAYDSGVATMVANALDPARQLPAVCAVGPVF
jgi:hypothetical protein